MFRNPDQALSNLRTLAVRITANLAEPRLDEDEMDSRTIALDTHLHNLTAQFTEQFSWLDEYLGNHGTLPTDWRYACLRPINHHQDKEHHGEHPIHQR